jgi:2-polyprenyl-3-methyl-5-hydroxy-6-metoxy-1,4-benzoquinol methylase
VTDRRRHYSYTAYADPEMARTFEERRFGGTIGEYVAADQAAVLVGFAGDVRGRTILDVGTGTGRAALLLARQGAAVTGLDSSEAMLCVARARAAEQSASVRFVSGDVQALSFEDRAFDVVVSLRVLMHAPLWKQSLAELCRVASRSVIVDYPSARSFALWQSLGRKALYSCGVRTEPYRVFRDADIEREFRSHAFRIRSTHRQFVLPIALHKAIGSRYVTERSEGFLERVGLLKRCGSPVTVLAERA